MVLKAYIFPLSTLDFFSDLDKYSGQGLMNYEVSMSTLNEVFMNVEGESTTNLSKNYWYKSQTRSIDDHVAFMTA